LENHDGENDLAMLAARFSPRCENRNTHNCGGKSRAQPKVKSGREVGQLEQKSAQWHKYNQIEHNLACPLNDGDFPSFHEAFYIHFHASRKKNKQNAEFREGVQEISGEVLFQLIVPDSSNHAGRNARDDD